ncbi:MAG: hypothetical protein ACJAYE_001149 [Candidatus Azotimanducaceae bacterium]|jgi:uncharacterized protein (TIGR00251 family)
MKPINLKVKVVPGAAQSAIVGWLGDSLKIRISTAPEKGKANDAVLRLLADSIGLPKTALRLASGHRSPHKVVEISGISEAALMKALALE